MVVIAIVVVIVVAVEDVVIVAVVVAVLVLIAPNVIVRFKSVGSQQKFREKVPGSCKHI